MFDEKIKKYTDMVKKYQIESNHKKELEQYLTKRSYELSDKYCSGKSLLPNHELVTQVQNEVMSKYSDEYLSNLFEELAAGAKDFYSNLINLIAKDNDAKDFDGLYQDKVKHVGQKLINILRLIKYRIQHLDNMYSSVPRADYDIKRQKSSIIDICKYYNILVQQGDNLLFKILFHLRMSYEKLKSAYYLATFFSLLLLWGTSYINYNAGDYYSIYIKLLISFMTIIISVLIYPFEDFGKVDVSGVDVVAYKYKTFLNNIDKINLNNAVEVNIS